MLEAPKSCERSICPLPSTMGGIASKQTIHSTNDYELVIRSAKELEWILDNHFGATGQGLHQKVSSVTSLPPQLVKQMRWATRIPSVLVSSNVCEETKNLASCIHLKQTSCAHREYLVPYKQHHQSAYTPTLRNWIPTAWALIVSMYGLSLAYQGSTARHDQRNALLCHCIIWFLSITW